MNPGTAAADATNPAMKPKVHGPDSSGPVLSDSSRMKKICACASQKGNLLCWPVIVRLAGPHILPYRCRGVQADLRLHGAGLHSGKALYAMGSLHRQKPAFLRTINFSRMFLHAIPNKLASALPPACPVPVFRKRRQCARRSGDTQ